MQKKGKYKRGRDQGCPIAKDLRTPKYKKRVVADKKKKADKENCRNGDPEQEEKKKL